MPVAARFNQHHIIQLWIIHTSRHRKSHHGTCFPSLLDLFAGVDDKRHSPAFKFVSHPLFFGQIQAVLIIGHNLFCRSLICSLLGSFSLSVRRNSNMPSPLSNTALLVYSHIDPLFLARGRSCNALGPVTGAAWRSSGPHYKASVSIRVLQIPPLHFWQNVPDLYFQYEECNLHPRC